MSEQAAARNVATGQHRAVGVDEPLAAAKQPAGMGPAAWVGIVVAVVVLAIGVFGVVEFLIGAGVIGGGSWVKSAATSINGTRPARWLIPAGIVLVALGLWLLVAALRPRPRRMVALQSDTGVFMRPADTARVARSAASRVDGVADAHASANRRSVTIRAEAINTDTGAVKAAIEQAVNDRLRVLVSPPKIRVTVRTEGGSR